MTPRERADLAQQQASDPASSVFVTANAGSGKTKVLVDRIARLLLGGSPPSAFLCITYTKAAAAEMQRRLFERLGAWCVASDEALRADLGKLGAPAESPADLGRARALFARALETPGGLKIQTIHAFCERLLARFPLEAGVPPGFDIADEARSANLLQISRADCILRADTQCAAALARFAARLPGDNLDGLLNRLVWQRTQLAAFTDASALRRRHGPERSADGFSAEVVAAIDWAGLDQARGLLEDAGGSCQAVARRIGEARRLHAAGKPPRAVLTSFIRIAVKQDGDPYGRLVTNALADQQPWLKTFLDNLAEQAIAANDALKAIDRADDAAAASVLAQALARAYAGAKARAGALDFDDLIVHARALLSNADAAPWVLFKLDGGLDHILIDEGQDTSASQWELIAPLQDEFFAGEGARPRPRTVFAVGDPKQSIYAFQGADPERFLAESQALEARARLAERDFAAPSLETSFRTVPEILRVVDATFEGEELAPGALERFNVVQHFASREHEHGLVEVWPIARRPARNEARPWDAPLDVETEATAPAALAKAVAKEARRWIDEGHAVWERGALRPMRPGDILALVRKRSALFYELIKAFKRVGFPVAGADRMTLKDELAVEDALALIRVALDPEDDLSLANVLKGPWLNLEDDNADLFPLAHGRAPGETLRARLMANGEAKYAEARAFVADVIARSGADAFAFLSWALETRAADGRSGWERVFARLGSESRDPLEELLSRALKPGAHAAPSLQRFLHEIETDLNQVKRELEASGESVRVMTVHGAKGLEAPVVILPDCAGPTSDKPEDGIMFAADGPYLSASDKYDDAATRAVRQDFKRRAAGEHLRLLYVGMTRARDRLIVCGAQHGGSKAGETPDCWRLKVERALSRIGEACETPFGEGWRLGAPAIAAAGATDVQTISPLPAWAKQAGGVGARVDLAAPSRLKRIDPAMLSPRGDGQRRFRRGRLIHGLLERLPEIAPERRAELARAWLARRGVDAAEADALAQEAIGVIASPDFAAAFGPSSRAEAPIVGAAGGRQVRGVVDRLAVETGGVLVVDFKTDRPAPETADAIPDSYLLQMALYRVVVGKIFADLPVRCALVWTEAPRLMELEPARLDAVFETFARG